MINWEKWILEQLPLRRRTLCMFAFCKVLSSPVIRLYVQFEKWRAKMRIQSGCMPLTCMLEKMVYDELGIRIFIQEGNGKPYDFIINSSFQDTDMEKKLFALLDRYKIAGKSYGYANTEIVFKSEFGSYLCEKCFVSSDWTTYICEQGKQINRILFRYEPEWIHIKSEFPVASDIYIEAYNDDSGMYIGGSFKRGDNTENVFPWGHENGVLPSRFVIEPVEDETYKYIIEWQQ